MQKQRKLVGYEPKYEVVDVPVQMQVGYFCWLVRAGPFGENTVALFQECRALL